MYVYVSLTMIYSSRLWLVKIGPDRLGSESRLHRIHRRSRSNAGLSIVFEWGARRFGFVARDADDVLAADAELANKIFIVHI